MLRGIARIAGSGTFGIAGPGTLDSLLPGLQIWRCERQIVVFVDAQR